VTTEDATLLTVGPLADIEPDSARHYDVDGHRLAIIRLSGPGGDPGDDEVYVIGDRCSHADYSLSEGEVDRAEKTLECWKHGSTFSLETGEPTCFPATKPVPVYEAIVEDGVIKIQVSAHEGDQR
jgi:3-phenylpropionate/trans-cinnamate dioxygenase ferredoxin subunit